VLLQFTEVDFHVADVSLEYEIPELTHCSPEAALGVIHELKEDKWRSLEDDLEILPDKQLEVNSKVVLLALLALTGRTRLFEHRSNCRVRPVNAGSVDGGDIQGSCIETVPRRLQEGHLRRLQGVHEITCVVFNNSQQK
jgi:hypothetical protein